MTSSELNTASSRFSERRRIFVSYRRADSAAHAGRLYDGLVARFGAESVFMDMDAIPPGVDFRDVINDALSDCDIVLAVIGRQWLETVDANERLGAADDFVRTELETALQRADVRVVPVLVQGVTMPSPQDLPADLVPLAYRNAFELSDRRWRFDVDMLCQALNDTVPTRPAGAAEPSPWAPTHTVPRGGLTCYAGAEEGGRVNGHLDPELEVQVIRRERDWAQVVCANGWTAWVDARQLTTRAP